MLTVDDWSQTFCFCHNVTADLFYGLRHVHNFFFIRDNFWILKMSYYHSNSCLHDWFQSFCCCHNVPANVVYGLLHVYIFLYEIQKFWKWVIMILIVVWVTDCNNFVVVIVFQPISSTAFFTCTIFILDRFLSNSKIWNYDSNNCLGDWYHILLLQRFSRSILRSEY